MLLKQETRACAVLTALAGRTCKVRLVRRERAPVWWGWSAWWRLKEMNETMAGGMSLRGTYRYQFSRVGARPGR